MNKEELNMALLVAIIVWNILTVYICISEKNKHKNEFYPKSWLIILLNILTILIIFIGFKL